MKITDYMIFEKQFKSWMTVSDFAEMINDKIKSWRQPFGNLMWSDEYWTYTQVLVKYEEQDLSNNKQWNK